MNLPATAQQLAEKGISESHDHAEEVSPDWSRRAVEKVAAYAKTNEYFLAEAVKAWAYEDGLEVPPVDGAWGHVLRAAAKQGICHRFGRQAATSPGSHGKLMTLWKRGPSNVQQSNVTAEDAANVIRLIEEHANQMQNEGRRIIAEALRGTVSTIRALASDL
jgi:hypothetical protein